MLRKEVICGREVIVVGKSCGEPLIKTKISIGDTVVIRKARLIKGNIEVWVRKKGLNGLFPFLPEDLEIIPSEDR